MIDLSEFADAVGSEGLVTVTGLGTRGGPVEGVRSVSAPSGIDWVQPDEMIVCCGAGTPIDEVVRALAEHGQTVALPVGGSVGGALAVGRSDHRRLGLGPVRDVLLQARYVSAAGDVVKAGGPTVKNVSGFDLCRLLVGSLGTLGFLGEVLLRTRPLPSHSEWFAAHDADATRAQQVFTTLYRPTAVLWDGTTVWALLEGHRADVLEQARHAGLTATDAPPTLPTGYRDSIAPAAVWGLDAETAGPFVAEIGVGVVHRVQRPDTPAPKNERAVALSLEIKRQFDPTGRLNPGRSPQRG